MSAGPRGFSLVEVLFALTITVAGVLSVAQLLTVATNANRVSRTSTMAAVLAARRLEQLRALTWGFDESGNPWSDTVSDLTVEPPARTGGTGLSPSPDEALTRNVAGYFDWVDGSGQALGGSVAPPAGAMYMRRWAITRLPSGPDDTIVLQVLVTPWRARGAADRDPTAGSLPQETRLVSAKTRKAR